MFLAELSKYISRDVLKRNLRRLPERVFVTQSAVAELENGYRKWLSDSGAAIKEDKIKSRLYATEAPELFYLIEGKDCFLGYLMPLHADDTAEQALQKTQSIPINAEDYIHPRDPVLKDPKSFRVLNTPYGPLLEFSAGVIKDGVEKKVTVPVTSYAEFIRPLRIAKHIARRNPTLAGPLRDSVETVAELLRVASPVTVKQRLVLREADRGKISVFLRAGSIVFGIDGKGQLACCYDAGRRGEVAVIDSEIKRLCAEQRDVGGGIRFERIGSQFLLSLRMNRERYRLHHRAFRSFFESLRRNRRLGKKLPNRYTLRDVIETLVRMLRDSKETGRKTLKRMGKKKKLVQVDFRDCGSWVFVVLDGSIIYDFRFQGKRKERRKPGSPPPDRPV